MTTKDSPRIQRKDSPSEKTGLLSADGSTKANVTVKTPTQSYWVWIVWGVFELLLIIGLALMFVKYLDFIDAKCEVLNATNGSNSTLSDRSFYANNQKMEYGSYMHIMLIIFTTFISLLNMLELLTLAAGTYKWLRTASISSWRPSRKATSSKCVVWVVIVLFGFLLFAMGMVAFAVMMELEKDRCEHENSFGTAIGCVYIVHAALDFLNALSYSGVRIWMIIHAYKVKAIWTRENDVTVQLTSTAGNYFEELADNVFFYEYEIEYKKRGRLAMNEMLPFVSWFPIPLLSFIFLALVNPHLLLTPWTYNHNGHRSKVIAKSRYFYFCFVLIKFIQLLVQYGCVWRMNQYNEDYYDDMERRVLYKYGHPDEVDDSPGVVAVKDFRKRYIIAASQKKMKFRSHFNFEPSFLSFKPKIQIENPLYILGIILGLLVSSSDFLYK